MSQSETILLSTAVCQKLIGDNVFIGHIALEGFAVVVQSSGRCHVYTVLANGPEELAACIQGIVPQHTTAELTTALQRALPKLDLRR